MDTDERILTCCNDACPWKEFTTQCIESKVFEEIVNPVTIISKIREMAQKLKKSEQERLIASRNVEKLIKRTESLTESLDINVNAYESNKTQLKEELEAKTKTVQEVEALNLKLKEELKKCEEILNATFQKNKQLEDDKNNIYVRWKDVTNQRDELISQKESENSPITRDEIRTETIHSSKSSSLSDKHRVPMTSNFPWTPGTQVTLGLPEDAEVTLRRKDVEGHFGIRFGIKRGPPLLNESNIIVIKVNHELVQDLVRVNDFVIEINSINVQNGNMEIVKEACIQRAEEMTLKLRPLDSSPRILTFQGVKEQYQDWGLTFGVFIKKIELESYSHKIVKLREFDEIIKVNGSKVGKLSLKDIYRKMNSRVTFEISRNETGVGYCSSVPSIKQDSIPASPDNDVPTQPNTYSSEGSSSLSGKPDENLSETINLTLCKPEYEIIGLRLRGGNKSGIFIEQVENWSCAQKAEIKVGWKVLQIDCYDLNEAALCYAVEVLSSLRHATNIQGMFQKVPEDEYQKKLSNTPHDSFYVRAIKDYKSRHGNEFSFKVGDKFLVVDSFVQTENQLWKWKAQKEVSGLKSEKFLPYQQSLAIVRTDLIDENKKRKQKKTIAADIYFELLDNVDAKRLDPNVVVM